MQNDILVTHGVDPLAVQMIRNPLNSSRINVVHFLKQKSCRTAVGLSRASTSSFPDDPKTWMAGSSPAMTIEQGSTPPGKIPAATSPSQPDSPPSENARNRPASP